MKTFTHHQIALPPDAEGCEVDIREPGIVLRIAVLKREKRIAGPSGRGAEEVPVLFARVSPDGEMRRRRFVFIPHGHTLEAKAGMRLEFVDVLLGSDVRYVYELVDDEGRLLA